MAKAKLPRDRYEICTPDGIAVHVQLAPCDNYVTLELSVRDDLEIARTGSLETTTFNLSVPNFFEDKSRFLAIYKPDYDEQQIIPGKHSVVQTAHPHKFRGEDGNVYAFDYVPLEEAPWFSPQISLLQVSALHMRDVLDRAVAESADAVAAAHTQAREAVARLRSLQKELTEIQRDFRTYRGGAELTMQGLHARVQYSEARGELLFQQQNLFRNALAAYASEESWSGDSKNTLVNSNNGFTTAADALSNVVAKEIP